MPLSSQCRNLIINGKIKLKDIFSRGDDYQFLFTSAISNRKKIKCLSKNLSLKITKIGQINNKKVINLKYNNEIFDARTIKMGYTHNFK